MPTKKPMMENVIRWTNKLSNETGFVKAVHSKEQYFENTFELNEAISYTDRAASVIIGKLNKYCDQNIYTPVKFKKTGKKRVLIETT